jgi:hypothetical protein
MQNYWGNNQKVGGATFTILTDRSCLSWPVCTKFSDVQNHCSKYVSRIYRQSWRAVAAPPCLRCFISVADPGCFSRVTDPDFYPSPIPDLGSRIPDPKTATKERCEKKFVVIPFFVAINFTKLKISLFWNAKKLSLLSLNRGLGSGIRDPGPGSEIREPGSGKNLFRIPDPGVKKDPGSGSATLCFIIRLHVWKYLWSISGWVPATSPVCRCTPWLHHISTQPYFRSDVRSGQFFSF